MENAALRRWQWTTVALMTIGYAGYYLCRSNLSVCMPLIIAELERSGIDAATAKIQLGGVASFGVLAYAFGKFVSGGAADFFGGRRNFLAGMGGSILFTLLFAIAGGFPLFTVAWIGNRLVQSFGWVGMVKLTSRWFAHSEYGRAMGVISLSYLFGDAVSRKFMAILIASGFDWRTVFFITAAVLSAIFVVTWLILRESPTDLGLMEPAASPENLFGNADQEAAPLSLRALILPMLRNVPFLLVCVLSLSITLVRETFNTWTPTYFTEALGMSTSDAASWSSLFPLFGAFSVLLAGWGGDRLGQSGRALIIVVGLLATVAALATLGSLNGAESRQFAVWLVAAIGFVMIGPYSYLGGAIALDFGGKRGSATACGIIDGVGYLAGVLAGGSMARISTLYGWQGAYMVLAGVALLATIAALAFLRTQSPTKTSAVAA